MQPLEAGPCQLRPWRESDLDALVRHANNPAVAKNLRDRFPHPYTRADGETWLQIAAAQAPVTNFAIEYEGEAVGGVGLILGTDIERVSAELGYWLGESVWGRGLATAAARALCDHGFRGLGLTRIFAHVFAHHRASCRVLEKAGFTFEAILRRSAIKGGIVLDQAMYGRIAE